MDLSCVLPLQLHWHKDAKMNNAQKVFKKTKYTATHAKVWEALGKMNDDVICDKHRT